MNETWKQTTLATLQTIFRDQFLDERLKVSDRTTPADIDEWDSLAHINLLAAVESAFKVRFSADEMSAIDSVETLLVALDRRVNR